LGRLGEARKNEAILKEKQMKKWNRAWKIKLIEEKNPKWEDLFGSSAF
jgi:putative endonuclease